MKAFITEPAQDILLVIAGYNRDGPVSEVEAFDLSGQGRTCTAPASLPYATFETSSLKTADGNPFICGGQRSESLCQEYIPELDSWEDREGLLDRRQASPAVEIANNDYWIIGGFEEPDTSEICF